MIGVVAVAILMTLSAVNSAAARNVAVAGLFTYAVTTTLGSMAVLFFAPVLPRVMENSLLIERLRSLIKFSRSLVTLVVAAFIGAASSVLMARAVADMDDPDVLFDFLLQDVLGPAFAAAAIFTAGWLTVDLLRLGGPGRRAAASRMLDSTPFQTSGLTMALVTTLSQPSSVVGAWFAVLALNVSW